MWLNIVYLTFGVLLIDPFASGTITCKTIDISAQNFTTTIHLSSFICEYDGQFYNCVCLKSESNNTTPKVQWTGRFHIIFSRNRWTCANSTVQINYEGNGVAKSDEVRPNIVGNGPMSNKFTMKICFDSNTGVSIIWSFL